MKRKTKTIITNKAIAVMGITENPYEAGFILEDGTMLDFSGKSQGDRAGVRNLEHNEISAILEDIPSGIEAKYIFVQKTNAIRMSLRSNSDLRVFLGIKQTPTGKQWDKIEEVRGMGGINYQIYGIVDIPEQIDSGSVASVAELKSLSAPFFVMGR